MIIKNNIWTIFYLIFFGALSLIIWILYIRFAEINYRHYSQLEHYTEIVAKTINADFLQKSMLLDIVGKQLLDSNTQTNIEDTKIFLDSFLKRNPYLVGFGLFDVNGSLITTSSNIKIKKKINLLNGERTRYGFEKALASTSMVIGRTYFFGPINEWIIPLRKAIRDKDGNLLGVIAAGYVNNKNKDYLDNLRLSDDNILSILKDFNDEHKIYRQYFSKDEDISYENLYNFPISNKLYKNADAAVKQKYKYSLDELRTNGDTVSIKIIDSFKKTRIAGISYDKKYNLWVIVESDISVVWYDFLNTLIINVCLFIISFFIIYTLFKNIATSEKRKKEELIYQTQHDTLTGLPNRTYMYDNIGKWISEHTNKFDVLYIDLDNFKNINDKFGHTIGDIILMEVANRLRSFFDKENMLIRQGGDEFIVFQTYNPVHDMEENFENLINLVSKVYKVKNKNFRIGMSLGIARYPKDSKKIEKLLSLADTAMYEAKKRKNSYCYFSEKMRHANLMKMDIEQELRGAIENDELWMAYQPQIKADGSLYGVEALSRWNNKKLGNVRPDKFITVAEETGLIKELGKFIITTSLREIKIIQEQLELDFSLSINISAIQLMEDGFLETILQLVDDEKFDKTKLTLEITESLSIEDLDKVLPRLHSIRETGIEISLDDFGTGYSSLSVLKKLPINELKIDKSFIDEILYDENEKVLVQSIINIGKNFGMITLAEGVESFEQVQELKNHNCDIFQGYYFSKPLSKHDLIKYLNKKYKG